jgi:hypothetical protein
MHQAVGGRSSVDLWGMTKEHPNLRFCLKFEGMEVVHRPVVVRGQGGAQRREDDNSRFSPTFDALSTVRARRELSSAHRRKSRGVS